MRFNFVRMGEVVGNVSFDGKRGYVMEFNDEFHWFQHYLMDLLSSPMYDGEEKLIPPSPRHLKATIQFIEILKETQMDWYRFINAVGGDIREIEVVEVSDE